MCRTYAAGIVYLNFFLVGWMWNALACNINGWINMGLIAWLLLSNTRWNVRQNISVSLVHKFFILSWTHNFPLWISRLTQMVRLFICMRRWSNPIWISTAISISAWTGPYGLQEVEATRAARQSSHEDDKGCQPFAPAAFNPRRYPWYLFLLQAQSTPGLKCGWKEKSLRNPNDSIGKGAGDLPARSTVPQPRAPTRTNVSQYNYYSDWCGFPQQATPRVITGYDLKLIQDIYLDINSNF
jgi:hypothetical protein